MEPSEAHAATLPETVIAPPRRLSWPVGELWEFRDLIYFLTKRELQIRYKQSFFGIGWAVLQPLALAFIFALVFGTFLHADYGIPTAVFVVAGIVPWLFTGQAVQMGANSLVLDSDLISKVYFPRLALPIAKALSLVLDLAVSFVVVLLIALIYGVAIQSTIYLVPAFLLLSVVTTFALSSLLAAINVKYRDVQLVTPMLVQVLFFLTPVVYPVSFIPGDWKYVYAINPLSSAIDGIRWALFGTTAPSWGVVGISVASALILTLLSMTYFQRTERFFADHV
jgi:homopolymeric O-antigen transport system permease protein